MDDKARTARIENKIDTIIDRLGEQDVHLAEIKKDLAYHVHRTNLLEHKVLPVIKIYQVVCGVVAIIGLLAAVADILGYFHGY